MDKKKVFILIGIFWILIIGGFIFFKEFTLKTGEEILLKNIPVDPRDLFRGDYVILRYEISEIKTDELAFKGSDFEIGDDIFVLLNIDDTKQAILSDIAKVKPEDKTFIKGTIKKAYDNRLVIEYGIESYFVPENTGKEIERERENIYTKIALDGFGRAVIKNLVLDGEDI